MNGANLKNWVQLSRNSNFNWPGSFIESEFTESDCARTVGSSVLWVELMELPFSVWLFIKRLAWPAFLEKHQPRNGPRVLATSSFDFNYKQELAATMGSKLTLSKSGFLISQQAKEVKDFYCRSSANLLKKTSWKTSWKIRLTSRQMVNQKT